MCLSVSSRKPPDPLGAIAVCQCLRCLTVIEGGLRKRADTKTYPPQHVADSRRHWADGLNGSDYHIRRAGDWDGQKDGPGHKHQVGKAEIIKSANSRKCLSEDAHTGHKHQSAHSRRSQKKSRLPIVNPSVLATVSQWIKKPKKSKMALCHKHRCPTGHKHQSLRVAENVWKEDDHSGHKHQMPGRHKHQVGFPL